MNDAIIVLNAGSSSLKFSLYRVNDAQLVLEAHGQIEGLGTSPHFKAKNQKGEVLVDTTIGSGKEIGHAQSFACLADWIRDHYGQKLRPLAIGHRIVHGGMDFAAPVLIDQTVMSALQKLIPLAPLHQPHNLAAIEGVANLNPGIPQVACFDTAFHRGRPTLSQRFALPNELFEKGLRRWGFHGLSYQSIAAKFRHIAPELAAGKVIAAHLGSGASLCAMVNGRSVDTTMGFSVLDGLPMGTRCGSLDPGVVLFLLGSMTPAEVESMLYRKSGLLGISGVSNDVRELLASDEPLAEEAVDYFVYRIIREIGSLTAALNGMDALIFTAGVGENSPVIRQRVCQGLSYLGIKISVEANETGRSCISRDGTRPSVWVIPTDEEHVIASDTHRIVRTFQMRS